MFNDFVFSRLQLFQSRDEGFHQVTARQCELRSITVSVGFTRASFRYKGLCTVYGVEPHHVPGSEQSIQDGTLQTTQKSRRPGNAFEPANECAHRLAVSSILPILTMP